MTAFLMIPGMSQPAALLRTTNKDVTPTFPTSEAFQDQIACCPNTIRPILKFKAGHITTEGSRLRMIFGLGTGIAQKRIPRAYRLGMLTQMRPPSLLSKKWRLGREGNTITLKVQDRETASLASSSISTATARKVSASRITTAPAQTRATAPMIAATTIRIARQCNFKTTYGIASSTT